jgi:hypothetical protein
MLTRTVAYYEVRVVFGAASLLPALLLPACALFGWFVWVTQHRTPAPGEILMAFALALPLGSALAACHLMTIEREEDFDSLRRSYPEPAWRVPLMRAAGAALFMLASAGLSALIFSLTIPDFDFDEMVAPIFAPALYLTALGLLVNNVIGNYWVSAVAVCAYWYAEYQTHGQYTGVLYLFNNLIPLPDVEPNLNRGLLLALAVIGFTLNIGYSIWRRRRGVG